MDGEDRGRHPPSLRWARTGTPHHEGPAGAAQGGERPPGVEGGRGSLGLAGTLLPGDPGVMGWGSLRPQPMARGGVMGMGGPGTQLWGGWGHRGDGCHRTPPHAGRGGARGSLGASPTAMGVPGRRDRGGAALCGIWGRGGYFGGRSTPQERAVPTPPCCGVQWGDTTPHPGCVGQGTPTLAGPGADVGWPRGPAPQPAPHASPRSPPPSPLPPPAPALPWGPPAPRSPGASPPQCRLPPGAAGVPAAPHPATGPQRGAGSRGREAWRGFSGDYGAIR